MKKTGLIGFILVLILGLSVGGAQAYTFSDVTDVQEWRNGGLYGSGVWKDVIGDTSLFNTFGADLSGNTLTIYTNWNPNKDGSVDALVKTADLFIDLGNDGTMDIAIQLDTLTGKGNVYATNLTYKTSNAIFASTGLIYGGKYDETNPQLVPTEATSVATGTTSVVWTITNGLNNEVAISLSGLSLTSTWSFVWGTARCSNDGFSAVVPLPNSVLLLGSGLLGLVGVGFRKRGN